MRLNGVWKMWLPPAVVGLTCTSVPTYRDGTVTNSRIRCSWAAVPVVVEAVDWNRSSRCEKGQKRHGHMAIRIASGQGE